MVKDIIEKSIQLFKLLYVTCLSNKRVILFFSSTTLEGNLIKALSMCVHIRMLIYQVAKHERVSLAVSELISARQELGIWPGKIAFV